MEYHGYLLEPGIIQTPEYSVFFYRIRGTRALTPFTIDGREHSRILAELFLDGFKAGKGRGTRRPIKLTANIKKIQPDVSKVLGYLAGVYIGTKHPPIQRLLGRSDTEDGAHSMVDAFCLGFRWKGGCTCYG